jgi:hypothetical protein
MYGETTYFKDPTVTKPQGGDQIYSAYALKAIHTRISSERHNYHTAQLKHCSVQTCTARGHTHYCALVVGPQVKKL